MVDGIRHPSCRIPNLNFTQIDIDDPKRWGDIMYNINYIFAKILETKAEQPVWYCKEKRRMS